MLGRAIAQQSPNSDDLIRYGRTGILHDGKLTACIRFAFIVSLSSFQPACRSSCHEIEKGRQLRRPRLAEAPSIFRVGPSVPSCISPGGYTCLMSVDMSLVALNLAWL